MPVISSRISGWRVTDSITLPKIMPMPTPAPTAPRPPPTPRAIARPAAAALSSPAWARRVTTEKSRSTESLLCLVVLGDGAAEVDGSQRGEDERLKRRHQADLEEEQRDPERQREGAEELEAEDHRQAARHEEDDQVAGEDVGEETYGERDQPHEVRQRLEREHRDGREPADARRDQRPQVAAEALGPNALDVVGDEHDKREDERDRHVGRRRVEREGRDLGAEELELLVRVGRQR